MCHLGILFHCFSGSKPCIFICSLNKHSVYKKNATTRERDLQSQHDEARQARKDIKAQSIGYIIEKRHNVNMRYWLLACHAPKVDCENVKSILHVSLK